MMTLKERIYTALKELHVMPGDIDNIQNCMMRIDQHKQKELINNYKEIWRSTYDKEPNILLKANAARKAANLWILKSTEEAKNESTTTIPV